MKHKRLTDSQLIYIFNTILLPKIEYRSQHMLPSESQCKSFVTTYLAFVKRKLKLSRHTLTALFHSHYFYNLTLLYQRLIQNFSNALLHMLMKQTFLEDPFIYVPSNFNRKNGSLIILFFIGLFLKTTRADDWLHPSYMIST